MSLLSINSDKKILNNTFPSQNEGPSESPQKIIQEMGEQFKDLPRKSLDKERVEQSNQESLKTSLTVLGQKSDAIEIIEEKIPEGIILKNCGYGYGMFASKDFKKGETLYKQKYRIIPNEEKQFLIKTDQGNFTISTTTHTVIMPKGRALYTFDAHINHSCDPNTYSFVTPEMIDACEYEQVAAKDIKEGEELTCNYNLFDYDCRDKKIDECQCGSNNCKGAIHGFKYLPLEEQLKLLKHVDISIVEQFYKDHPERKDKI